MFIHYFKHIFFFFSQRLVEAAEDAYLKHEFDADLQVINNYLLKYSSSAYPVTVYTIACLKLCSGEPSPWVMEGCWLQTVELMKAGSVFWWVTHLTFVCGETKQVDCALSQISFTFPACLLGSRFLNTVISSVFHRCSELARNCSTESWICRWAGTHRDGISMTLIWANGLHLDLCLEQTPFLLLPRSP